MALPLVPVFEHVITRCQEAGIPVVEWEGPHPSTGKHVKWRDMQMPYSSPVTPVGILNHHTAPPVPYPLDKLADRCNWSIRSPDGAVCIVNAGIAYDSGYGDPKVLDRVKTDQPVMGRTTTWPTDFTADGRISGTRWYIDCEVQHPGDGSPLPEPMLHSLVVSDAAICEHYGWDPASRLLGHLEWTRRKIDPYWNGIVNSMPSIRLAVAAQLAAWNQGDADMTTPDFVRRLSGTDIDALVDADVILGDPDKAKRKAYWKAKLTNPQDPEWVGFHQEVEAAALVNAAVGRGGGSSTLNVALTGKATPA